MPSVETPKLNKLTPDEETIVRGAVGLAAPIGGGPLDEAAGRVWGPIERVEINGKQGGSGVACRACGGDIHRGEEAIRFGWLPLGSKVNVRPAYLHAERCRG